MLGAAPAELEERDTTRAPERSPVPGAEPAPILGGEDVRDNAWPDVAAVYFDDGWGHYVSCTGVLVAPDVVLTAGHCAEGISQVKLNTDDYEVGGELIDVAEIHEYPNSWANYDIAALVLKSPSVVPPARIAQDCVIDDFLFDGAPAAIVGYGGLNTDSTRYVSELQEGFTSITDADCSRTDWGCNASVRPDGEVGAGGDGVDTCPGDSGGPMYLTTDYGNFLVGITSRAWSWASKPCGDGGIYSRPDAVIEWIEDVTNRSIERLTCDNEPPEPEVEPIVCEKESAAVTSILANDPDQSDVRYVIQTPPEHGAASVDADGTVHFHAENNYVGDDRIVVSVIDRGIPGYTIPVEIPVQILRHGAYRRAMGEGGCGCENAGSTGSAWAASAALLALAALRRRRSR
jgi:hypothetical protein